MKELNIVSPTREKPYTVADAVGKLLARRNFKTHRLEKYDGPYSQGYSDYDGFLFLDAETLPSHWGPSIEARVQAYIPFHVTNAEAYHMPESEYFWESTFPVKVSAWLLDNGIEARDEVQFYWSFGNDPAQREVQELIEKVAKRALVAFAMEHLPTKGFCADYRKREIEIPDLFE